MRILLLTQHFPPEEGPHAYRWGWLARRFAELGHRVDVVVPRWRSAGDDGRHPDRDPGDGITVHETTARIRGLRLTRRIANELLTAAAAYRLARRECPDPDVIIGTVPSLPTLPVAVALGRRARRPVVAEMRDAWPDLVQEWQTWGDTGTATRARTPAGVAASLMGVGAPLVRRAYSALQRGADLIVTTTDSWARVLGGRRMPPITVIRNTNMAIKERLPAPPPRPGNSLQVLYAGNIGRAQHLATAIRAASLCHRAGVPVRLRIFGTGAEAEAMRTFNHRLGEPAEIFDRVPIDQVAEHYDWADTVLISLRAWESMGWSVPSKLYEALSSGRHITVSAPGESAEIVSETGAGHVVPPEDPEALAELWTTLANDRSLLDTGSRGPEWVAAHADRDELPRRYLEALRSVADGR